MKHFSCMGKTLIYALELNRPAGRLFIMENQKFVVIAKSFLDAFEICSVLSMDSHIEISVNEIYIPDKFGMGNIEYTITYYYKDDEQ